MSKMKAILPALFSVAMLAGATVTSPLYAQTSLTAVLEAEIVTLDPHFTPAYISRTFGFMVFDTPLAKNAKGEIKPQMVKEWKVSDDTLTYTFTMRDGLKFHDGSAVTTKDVVASLKRWAPRNAVGRRMLAVTESIESVDDKTFVIKVKEPTSLVLDGLSTILAPNPFIIPERLANTPGDTRITEIIGSGPFVYNKADHRTGDRMTLKKFADYKPREEPADFLAGGKKANVDQLIIRVIPDGSTAASALQTGEIDFMQYAPFDLLPIMEKNKNLRVINFTGPHMFQGTYRLNTTMAPFDDQAIRRVLQKIVDQQEVMDGLGLGTKYAMSCKAYFMCGSALGSEFGSEGAKRDLEAAKKELKATKYAGEKIILMQQSDLEAPKAAAQIMAENMKAVGFNVDLQLMDWATVLARRTKKDGWHMYGVHAGGFDLSSPLTNTTVAFNCSEYTGWYCVPETTELLNSFAKATKLEDQKKLADQIQANMYKDSAMILWGQFAQPAAVRSNVSGLIESAIPLFWNASKK